MTRHRSKHCRLHRMLPAGLLVGALGSMPTQASAHPSLLFSAEDVPALQTKIGSGVPQSAYLSMCGSIWWPEEIYDYTGDRCLEELAFRWAMTGDAYYAQQVSWWLAELTATAPSSLYDPNNVAWLATLAVAVSVAYDMAYGSLGADERLAVVSYLEQFGELLYGYLDNGTLPALSHEAIAAYAGLGLIGLTIRDESVHAGLDAWIDAAAQGLGRAAMRDAWNPGGAYDEGYGASLWGTPEAIRFAEAYRRATGIDITSDTNLVNAPSWYGYGWLPHFAYPSFGDAAEMAGQAYASEHLLLVGRTGDVVGKWAWHQAHGASGIDMVDRPGPVSGLLGVALWYPDAVPTIPDPLSWGYPLDAWFHDTHNTSPAEVGTAQGEGGMLVMRNGWGSDAAALVLKVSDEWQPHSHNDSSSFVLSAFGAEMVMDPASPSQGQRSDHNVVLASSYDDGAQERTSYRGAFRTVFANDFAAYAVADARYPTGAHDPVDPADPNDDVWTPVARADRVVAFMKAPRPYVIVADDVSVDGQSAVPYSWRLHLGQNSYGLTGGSGAPADPLRVDYYGGQQLLATILAPMAGYQALASAAPENPWHTVLSVATAPIVDARFLVLLQPRRWAGDPEQPYVSDVPVSGGVAADLYWSDGVDRVAWRNDAILTATDGTLTDARLLIVRQYQGTTSAWLAGEATRAVSAQGGLLETGGLVVSAASSGYRLDVQTAGAPAQRQIAAYGPMLSDVRLNGAPVGFVRAGQYVLLPAGCAAEERCNRLDDDCDGLVDEDDAVDAHTWYRDKDNDGYGDPFDFVRACAQPPGYVPLSGDCQDENSAAHPGAPKDCMGSGDNDCNGVIDALEPACVEVNAPEDTTLFTCSLGPARSSGRYGALPWGGLGLLGAAFGWRRARASL